MTDAKLWNEYVKLEQENIRLKDRLGEAHQLLQDAVLYGCNSKWAARLAAHLGTADSAPATVDARNG